MANKIKKMINNGVSYTVGGVESSNDTYENIIHLSQAEYDALETKDPDTLYSTPDADSPGGFNPENAGTTGQVLTKTETGYAYCDTPKDICAELFLIGGGGGGRTGNSGGAGAVGGGGAGGVCERSIVLKKGVQYCILIGNGGSANNNGGMTTFGVYGQGGGYEFTIAYGGGAGGDYGTSGYHGCNGGNGGGGGYCYCNIPYNGRGGMPQNIGGHQGGWGSSVAGGGGGGAGGDGIGTCCGMIGFGGAGICYQNFDGGNCYAAGGGGSHCRSYANGGVGGGGSGGGCRYTATSGSTCGSGGGGDTKNTGGSGKPGVAYINLLNLNGEVSSLCIETTGNSVTCGSYKGCCVYKFVCSGTFTIN